MSEHIVSKEQMEALKALADTNIKISEAKGALFKLQETETEYLVVREKKAMDRIEKTIADSREFVDEAKKNYEEVKDFALEASSFAESLIKARGIFHKLLEEFEERNVIWEQDIGQQQDEIAEEKKNLKAQKVVIENDRKSLTKARVQHASDTLRLAGEWKELDRAITRLKEGRI